MDSPKSSKSNTPAKTAAPAAAVAAPAPTNMTSATLDRTQALAAIKDAYQKNFEAMTQVTQALTTGAASVFQQQQTTLRNAMTQASTTANQHIASVAPQQCPEAIDRYKQAVDAGLANVRKIAELAEQSKTNAFNLIQKSISDRLQQRGQTMTTGLLANSPAPPAGTSAQSSKSGS